MTLPRTTVQFPGPDTDPRASPALWDSLDSDAESLTQNRKHRETLKFCSESSREKPAFQSPAALQGTNRTLRLNPDENWKENLEEDLFLKHFESRLSFDSSEETEDSLEALEDLAERRAYKLVSKPLHLPSSSPSSFHLHPQQRTFSLEDTSESLGSYVPSENTSLEDQTTTVSFQKRHSRHPPIRAADDIVERNRSTLGIISQKKGSYLKAHQQKDSRKEAEHPLGGGRTQQTDLSAKEFINHPRQTLHRTAGASQPWCEDAVGDPELLWLQKSQRLKAHKERKAPNRRKRSFTQPAALLKPQALEAKSPSGTQTNSHTDKLCSADPAMQAFSVNTPPQSHDPPVHLQSGPPTYSQAPTTVNLNINLQTPAGPAQAQDYTQQERVLNLVSQALGLERGTDNPLLSTLENAFIKNGFGVPAHKLPTFPNAEVGYYPVKPWQTHLANTVLPPIAKANARVSERTETQPSLVQAGSGGLYSQIEQRRRMKNKSSYKVYTLKEYKILKQEVKLGGLGPTNTVPEAVAEKIRRQKVYSDVIREKNKTISRIPPLSTKDPVSVNNDNAILRRKALEYAKTIAKPKSSPKLSERPIDKMQGEQEMDPTQLATLEMMKRHEEEKAAVALFRTLYAV